MTKREEFAKLDSEQTKLAYDIQFYHANHGGAAKMTDADKTEETKMKERYRDNALKLDALKIEADAEEHQEREMRAAKYAERPATPAVPLGDGASAAGQALPRELQKYKPEQLEKLRMRMTGEYIRGDNKLEAVAISKMYGAMKRDFGLSKEAVDALRASGPADMFALNEGDDSLGGGWVVPDFKAKIIMALPALSAIAGLVTTEPTSSDEAQYPLVALPTGDNASIASSDVSADWVTDDESEASILSASTQDEPGTGVVSVRVNMLRSKLIKITYRLQQDARADIAGIAQRLLSQAFALAVSKAYLSGSGVNRPRGILTDLTASQKVKTGAAAALTFKGLAGCCYGVNDGYAASPKAGWLTKRQNLADLLSVEDSGGRLIFMPTVAPDILMGYKIYTNPYMDTVAASNKPFLFGDFAQYYAADRAQMMIIVYREVFAPNIGLRAFARLGGKLGIPDAFRYLSVEA